MKSLPGSVFLAFVLLAALLSGCSPASTPVPPTFTPLPSPTLALPELIFSPNNLGTFLNDTDVYDRSAVDIFAPDGDVYLNLQVRGLEFPSEDASNGLVIDNNQEGSRERSIAFVYQESEWRVFEQNPRKGDYDLIWTNRSLPLDLELTIHLSSNGKTLELILPSGRRNLTLGTPLWEDGDRLAIRVQIAPKSRFEIVKLERLIGPASSPASTALPTQTLLSDLHNLDFEIEEGWELNQNQSKWPSFYIEYSNAWASHGDQSIKLFHDPASPGCDNYSHPWDRVEISQNLDLTGTRTIRFDTMPIITSELSSGWEKNLQYGQGLALEVYLDKTLVTTIDEMQGELLDQDIEIDNVEGQHTLTFRFRTLRESAYCNVVGIFVDNIRFLSK